MKYFKTYESFKICLKGKVYMNEMFRNKLSIEELYITINSLLFLKNGILIGKSCYENFTDKKVLDESQTVDRIKYLKKKYNITMHGEIVDIVKDFEWCKELIKDINTKNFYLILLRDIMLSVYNVSLVSVDKNKCSSASRDYHNTAHVFLSSKKIKSLDDFITTILWYAKIIPIFNEKVTSEYLLNTFGLDAMRWGKGKPVFVEYQVASKLYNNAYLKNMIETSKSIENLFQNFIIKYVKEYPDKYNNFSSVMDENTKNILRPEERTKKAGLI